MFSGNAKKSSPVIGCSVKIDLCALKKESAIPESEPWDVRPCKVT